MIKLFIIVNSLIVLVIGQQICPEDEYSYKNECIAKSCQQYVEKLTSKKKPSGKRFLSLNMNGKVIKQQQQYGIEIEFEDELVGVFNRDNKESCITDELYRHEMNYVHEIKEDTVINSTYTEKKRKWSFMISDLNDKLYQDKQTDKSIYNGFYTIHYFVKNYSILYYMFDFQIVIDNNNNLIETHFNDQVLDDEVACNFFGECKQKIYTEIRFCMDKDCQQIAITPNITLNKPLYLISEIQEEGFKDWYTLDYDLTFTSFELVKKFKPMYEQRLPGKTILQVIVPFVADVGHLYISSKLQKNKFIGRVLDNEIGSSIAIGNVEDAPCIKLDYDGQCPSQEQIIEINKLDCGSVDFLYCLETYIINGLLVLILMII